MLELYFSVNLIHIFCCSVLRWMQFEQNARSEVVPLRRCTQVVRSKVLQTIFKHHKMSVNSQSDANITLLNVCSLNVKVEYEHGVEPVVYWYDRVCIGLRAGSIAPEALNLHFW
jgi:hypothetical protein